jgi:hypothetical protein
MLVHALQLDHGPRRRWATVGRRVGRMLSSDSSPVARASDRRQIDADDIAIGRRRTSRDFFD